MNKLTKTRRGGPRTFDRADAVETAMRLFWRHGYEGVSISDLTMAIGIAPPSLYSAFGSKAGLYREALDRYSELPGALKGLVGAETAADAAAGLFREGIKAALKFPRERGCMVSSGMMACGVEHAHIARDLAIRRASIRDDIALAFSRWLPGPEAQSVASYFSAVLQGISVQARDGASCVELEAIAAQVIAGFKRTKGF